MALTEYKVMLISPELDKTKDLLNKLLKGTNGEDGLTIAIKAYATEMSLMTGMPEHLFVPQEHPICVAFTDDFRVFGFIVVGADSSTKTLCTEHVYVRPEVRHKGVYKLMMKRVEKLAKDIKFERIVSFVFDCNDTSKKAHKKQGFKRKMVGYVKEIEYENKD